MIKEERSGAANGDQPQVRPPKSVSGPGSRGGAPQSFTSHSITLPKGGGAIRGIGEKFAANPATGAGSTSVPIATSPGRSGFGPKLSLSYDSTRGNGPFGLGWSLSSPAISRKTDKGLPEYLDEIESDVFILTGTEDLVPVYRQDADGSWVADHPGYQRDGEGSWVRDPSGSLVVREDELAGYRVRRYRPRIEGLFARIERWSKIGTPGEVHWRSITKDNILSIYGLDANSRIYDPLDARRIYSWLLCESRDDKGNAILYRYRAEDGLGVDVGQAHEHNRGPLNDPRRAANRYLKRVIYGNRTPLLDGAGRRPRFLDRAQIAHQIANLEWMFEVVFDYGDHDATAPGPNDDCATDSSGALRYPWKPRCDPFSSYRAGFEIRTLRLCRRVLMFHHFASEAEIGRDCLVRSTDFSHSEDTDPTAVAAPVYTYLRSVTQTGYRRAGGGYDSRSFPPVEFGYTEPVVQDTLEEVDPSSLENLPVGLDNTAYRWTDLHGEGISGILTEQAGGWFYTRNLSAIPQRRPDGKDRVTARFAPVEYVAEKPNVALSGGARFMDLAGDGHPDVVVLDEPTPGFYEHDGAEGWERFRPFTSRLSRDSRDPNLRFVDLDGDGHADVLITEDDVLVWHPSLAEKGFGQARWVAQAFDEEKGPRVVFADAAQSIHLADLSGDGLSDIVRVRNGEVCYWPNLGYGHFGAKVTMDNAPAFDRPTQFDQRRVRLADIDGSGTTDLIYLHRDGVRLYFNQSGNSFSLPRQLSAFARIDDLVSVIPVDLLGNGTICLVWSSPLPGDARRPMRYVDLMGRQKPHLLVRVVNNLGAETNIEYATSTKFYLLDRAAGRPWLTRLPFPVHVVEKVTTYDHVGRNRFVSRYAYHHGYFDGEEREFRGFGMVEQWDAEAFATLTNDRAPAANIADGSQVPPVHTKSWFHTGIYLGRDHVSDFFAGLLNATDRGEYFREPGLSDAEARALLLPDTVLPHGLTVEEEREACRALKGSMLRQEIYADDALAGTRADQLRKAQTPYTVTEQNLTVRALQPRGANRHGVFFTHARESILYHYERNPADPRIHHTLTLEVDDYGNVLKQAATGYGRRTEIRLVDGQGNVRKVANPGLAALTAEDRLRQTTPLLTYTESRFTNSTESTDALRAPLPCEAVTFELTGYAPSGPGGRFRASDFVEPDPHVAGRLRSKFTDQVPYEAAATSNPCRRPIDWLRNLYRRDDLDALLPLGELQSRGLPGQSYKLAFTPGLLTAVFQRPRSGQPAESLLPDPATVLGGQGGDQGGYLQSQTLKSGGRFPQTDADDHWWVPSGQAFFSTDPQAPAAAELAQARQHFFLPRRHRDPFGQDAFVDFDSYDLLMTETRDALGNRVTAEANDYRVLKPRLVSDPNRNRTEVSFDLLGMVVGTAVMGKPAPAEGDTLNGFAADLTQAELDAFFATADPHGAAAALLQQATTRIIYDLDRFLRTRRDHPNDSNQWRPAGTATLARETHASDPLPPAGLRIRLDFGYSDGFGREIQKKLQAEPGPLVDGGPAVSPRWVGSGWTIFNNKGKPVRRYEPFFSTRRRSDGTLYSDHHFEFGATVGVSPVLFYDPAERVVATLHPNHTYEKVVFGPWQQTSYDVNDTCAPRDAQTGDPRNDPDIDRYVAGYFAGQPTTWQTWYSKRIGGALGQREQDAATRAAAHADTPTTAHFDVLGRPFLTVVRNRVVCAGHDLDGTEESSTTRVELDIEGNQRSVRDERKLPVAYLPTGAVEQRTVMRYAYDVLGNRIHQASMEAGARWSMNDVTGRPVRSWDSRGHNLTTSYDALRRLQTQTVRGTTAESDPRTLNRDVLVGKIEYGEGIANADTFNLRMQVYRHRDSSGVLTNARLNASGNPIEAFDFKGNLLASTRRLVSDYTFLPDWSSSPRLEAESFEAATRYDALNRPIQSVAPHSNQSRAACNVIQPVFNEASLLDGLDVWLERASEPGAVIDPAAETPSTVGVDNIDYDAKGRRLRIDYKNGATTSYRYDPDTFRLTDLYTRRGSAFTQDCDNPSPPPPTIASPDTPPRGAACGLQNLRYTYDPSGNITHIHDDAQQAIYFKNKRVEPSNDYTYDALYRLIQAAGREHLGQGGEPTPHSYNDAGRVGLRSADSSGHFAPNDGNAMGTYVERYVYDAAGNLLQMEHRGGGPAQPGWTRAYDYLEASLITDGIRQPPANNRLTRTTLGPNGPNPHVEPYQHDAHGNVTRMPHLGGGAATPNMHWSFQDQLWKVDLGGGGTAYVVYDASGERVRKVWEKAPGLIEERIYLGGFEIFRKHGGTIGPDTATFERETLHVMDDKNRIALVQTRTLDTAGNDRAPRQLMRYQFGNHLGSAVLELDHQARIISYEEYAPYGSSTYQAVRSQTETAKRYRYTGKERDEETGLYYHGARYYACWLARWPSTDPAGPIDGANLYVYVRDNPIGFTDRTGKQCDPTNSCCIDPTTPWPEQGGQSSTSPNASSDNTSSASSGTSSADSSSASSVSTGAFAANTAGRVLRSMSTSVSGPPGIPAASPGTDFAAAASRARRAFRAANAMAPGTQVQHWTKQLSAEATNMDPDVMNQNLSPLQSRNALRATTLLVSRNGGGTTYSVEGGSTFGNEHTFADRYLIPRIEAQIRAANPNATPREVAVEAGRQARWMMTGEPGPSPTPPPSTAGSVARTALRAGGTALAVGGTVLSGYAFSQDVSHGRWGSATLHGTAFVGGGLTVGGTAAGSTTLVTAGTIISAPAAVAGAGIAGWKLGQYTNEHTSISDVAMAGGDAVEHLTGSRTLGAIGAAGTAVLTAPVFVPIAVGKGIGHGAAWLWHKVF